MQEGAFVLIDCLGFKGIWKRPDSHLLLKKFSRLGPLIQERLHHLEIIFSGTDQLRIHNRLLSDTVAISFQFETRESGEYSDRDRQLLVFCACLITPLVMQCFLEEEPPLIFRGCVTYGKHFIENNFIVGPAIDEAAEYMNSAEGAFVWLHPNAAALYRQWLEDISSYTSLSEESIRERIEAKEDSLVSNVLMRRILELHGRNAIEGFFKLVLKSIPYVPFVIDPYRMPLKSGAHLDCPVINPLVSATSTEDRKAMIGKYSAFISGDKLDIWLKHQNTIEFLLEAHRQLEQFEEKMRSRGIDLAEGLRGFKSPVLLITLS
jgi:hypothetical protein